MDIISIGLLYVGWIAFVFASLNFEFSKAVFVFVYFLGVHYDENRTTSYRNNVRLFVFASCNVRD
jgi:hypothetical protein